MTVSIKAFTFNAFEVNTYLIWDETKECVIVDPGCNSQREEDQLTGFIDEEGLKPVSLINTHFHVDHVLGNAFISVRYNLAGTSHTESRLFWETTREFASVFGLKTGEIPPPRIFLNDGDKVVFGQSELNVVYTPGHADGSICLICKSGHFVVSGDVLFYGSIGRTDLPTGNYDKLKRSITEKLFSLPDDFVVYPGHGPKTTIGFEKKSNPFLS